MVPGFVNIRFMNLVENGRSSHASLRQGSRTVRLTADSERISKKSVAEAYG